MILSQNLWEIRALGWKHENRPATAEAISREINAYLDRDELLLGPSTVGNSLIRLSKV